jgi:hypothetical protein
VAGARASAPSSASTVSTYTEKDIIKNPAFRWEMEQKSGQPLSPCVEINGTCCPISAAKRWSLDAGQRYPRRESDAVADAPTDSACTDAQHAAMAAAARFGGHAAGANVRIVE